MLVDADLLALFTLDSPEGLEPPHLSPAWANSSLQFLEGIHRPKSEALKTIVMEHGWPLPGEYSDHAQEAAFMIVLHADYDTDFQKHCHGLMLEQATRGKTTLGFLAFLTDRILCNQGKHQRFGTQIREAANGCFVPKAVEDGERIDELRNQADLKETMLEYYQRVNGGDLLLPRPLLNGYAELWEGKAASNVIRFPDKQ